MQLRRPAILTALWLGTGAALGAREARAHCGDDCTAPLPYSLGPTSAVLTPDSVLVYPVADDRAAAALPFFTLTVTDAGGVAVDGNIEVDPEFSLIVWRPALPWVTGATYTATGRIDTAAWAEAEYGAPPGECTTNDYPVELTVEAESLPAPAAPPVIVETEHKVTPSNSLDALVCCDGAMPYLSSSGPGSCPSPELADHWHCVPRRDVGSLAVHHTLDRSALSPAVAGNLVSRVIGGTPAHRVFGGVLLYEPECLRLEILDVARGEVFVDERCFGDDIADQLGDIEVDPSAKLAEICEGQPYVCEVAGYSRWDRMRCKTWPEGADFEVPLPETTDPDPIQGMDDPAAEGCGCAFGGGAPIVWFGGLLLLFRRRAGVQRLSTTRR
ncbi:MAG: hypothetical protein H0T76_21535 [Nannocystis sp.]|nr:hypothetical protein [Nannocystis sp.]MBA3549075.1 hypothetical protein [Nannocystis sp.]